MKYIIANWKNYPRNFKETLKVANFFNTEIKEENSDFNFIICPPFIYLQDLIKEFSNLNFGVQDLFDEKEKICTGEITGEMLKNEKCKYVILGHSERRRIFNETDETINKKIKVALNNKIIPIICIGETLDQRKNNQTFSVIKEQLEKTLNGINLKNKDFMIAYEPIWSIGTGKIDSFESLRGIKDYLKDVLNLKGFSKGAVIYGGSVSAQNINQILNESNFDGVLIGKNSFSLSEMSKILTKISEPA